MIFPEKVSISTYSGSVRPIQGWYSEHLGQKRPTTTLVAAIDTIGSAELQTILTISHP